MVMCDGKVNDIKKFGKSAAVLDEANGFVLGAAASLNKSMGITKVSSVRRKQRVGCSLFSTKVMMDREDDFRNCPYGFVFK